MNSKPNGLIAAIPLRRVCQGVCARLGPSADRLRCAVRGESGTATVEFCMVFPIVMFLVLILLQVTLLMVGNHFVHYAAFAATRSAITYIPADFSGEGGGAPNTFQPVKGSRKYDAIRASAIFALVPVSGRLESNSEVSTGKFVSGLKDHFASYSQDAPKWIDSLAADRLRYAAANTSVEVMETVVTGQDVDFFPITSGEYYDFGPREAITVRVTHKLNLSVPYVRVFFADAGSGSKYTEVTAQYTLTNEGVGTELPAKPELPRDE
jgi:TadE-like protein